MVLKHPPVRQCALLLEPAPPLQIRGVEGWWVVGGEWWGGATTEGLPSAVHVCGLKREVEGGGSCGGSPGNQANPTCVEVFPLT